MSDYLTRSAALVDAFLEQTFTDPAIPSRLAQAMRYSLLAGGKRLRPVLCLTCAAACAPGAGDELPASVLPFAAGLEMIHTYSLIHDDLPAMDNDDLRRGKPSCHRAFDEATAILAGDALLTDAFAFMASVPLPAGRVLEALYLVSTAAGSAGMAGGQMLDLEAEKTPPDREGLARLNALKTGALLRAACECGAVLVGADDVKRQAVRRYGECFGLAFQITDDILDVVGDEAMIGKPVGSDAQRGKATWPALLGLDEACRLAHRTGEEAAAALPAHLFAGVQSDFLRTLALGLAERVQ